jgi:hypothetical protein
LSPILVRPVREQLEHDRVIRLLQQDLQKRKVEVGINPGAEQNASVGSGTRKEFPDVVVYSLEKGKKVVAVVEVETGESVNHLEAMAQWAHLAKLRVPFHLYVPTNSVDVARRLTHDYKISVTEIWSYHQVGEQFKFTLFHPASSSRSGRAATPPRMVSVASIRVALPLEPDPVVEEPVARSEPAGIGRTPVKVPGVKTIPARVVVPAPTPVKSPGKVPAGLAPRVVPAKATKPAPVKPSAKPVATASAKPAPVVAKPVVKAIAPRNAGSKTAQVRRPLAKTPAKPIAKQAGKLAPKSAAKPAKAIGRAATTQAKPTPPAAAHRSPTKVVKLPAKAAKPVARRK